MDDACITLRYQFTTGGVTTKTIVAQCTTAAMTCDNFKSAHSSFQSTLNAYNNIPSVTVTNDCAKCTTDNCNM